MPERAPAEDRFAAIGKKDAECEQRRETARREAEHKLRVSLVAQNEVPELLDDETNDEQRYDGNTQPVRRERVKPQPAADREQRDRDHPGTQTGVNHQRRQQINLHADEPSQPAKRRLHKHRDEREREDKDGVERAHGITTHTSSSRFMRTASFTRAT